MRTQQRFPGSMILLHWLIAGLIIAAFILGTVMTDMKISPTKLQYYAYHKWIGITVLGLVAVRLINRLLSTPLAYPAHMSPWQVIAANGAHSMLYVLMFAVPLSGYFYTSAAGYPVVYLGLFELPSPIAPNPEFKSQLKELHEILTYAMLALVSLHVAAVLKHQIIDKDGLLHRMLPGQTT